MTVKYENVYIEELLPDAEKFMKDNPKIRRMAWELEDGKVIATRDKKTGKIKIKVIFKKRE